MLHHQPRSVASPARTPLRSNAGLNVSFLSAGPRGCGSCEELQKELKQAKMRAESAFAELRAQMEAETAQLQTKLKTKETAMLLEQKTLLEEISRLQTALSQKEAEAARWRQEASDIPSREISDLSRKLETAAEDRKFFESEISSRDETIRNLRTKISDLSAVNFSTQEISDLQAQVASLAHTNTALSAELQVRQSEISSLRKSHADTEAALARLMESAKISDRIVRDSGISRAREEVARKKEVAEFERKYAQLEIQFARLTVQNSSLAQNFADVQTEARRVVQAKEQEISDLRQLLEIERSEVRKLGERNLSDRLFFEKIIREKHARNFHPETEDVSPVNTEASQLIRSAVRSRLEESAMLV